LIPILLKYNQLLNFLLLSFKNNFDIIAPQALYLAEQEIKSQKKIKKDTA